MTRLWSFDRSVTGGLLAMAVIAFAVSSLAVFATSILLPASPTPSVDAGGRVADAQALQETSRRMTYDSQRYAIQRDPADLAALQRDRADFLNRLRVLRSEPQSDSGRVTLARIVAREYAQQQAIDKRFLSRSGIEGGHDYRTDVLARRVALDEAINDYVVMQSSGIANSMSKVHRRLQRVQRWVLAISALALVLFLLMVLGLRRLLLGLFHAEADQRTAANRAREAAERWARSQAETEETTRLIVERALDGVVATDQHGAVTGWNLEAERIFGWRAEEILGRALVDVILLPRDRPSIASALQECALSGHSHLFDRRLELRGVRSDGGELMLEAAFTAIRRGTVFFVVFLHDISERRRIEASIRASEEEFRATFESAGIGHVRLEFPSGRCLRINPRMAEITGFALEDLQGEPFLQRLHPASPEADTLGLNALVQKGEGTQAVEALLTRRDGHEVWVHVTATIIPPSDRHPASILVVVQDLSQLRLAQSALRTTEERFRVMADSAPVLVWMSGPDGAHHWFNRPWLEFTGRSAEQEIGDGWTAGIHPEDRERCREVYERALARREAFTVEYRLRRHDGEWRWLLDNGVPLRGAGGEFADYIGSCIDISERKRAEGQREHLLESERRARAEAERANRTKDEFLATLSHELRTPLQAMLGWCRVLSTPGLEPAEMQHGLDVIERNVTLQKRLIEHLLDMSRIVQGKMQLEMREVRLQSIVDAALDVVRPAAEAKSIRIVADLPAELEPIVGDGQRLQQVVWNLLSNAIKFTPAGGTIELFARRVDEAVEVSVHDTGQGIRADFLPLVFGRFLQQDASTTRKHGGLGLGLAIVRNLVEMHGGRVWATSEGEGRGSTFTFQLPIRAERDAPGAVRELPAVSDGRMPDDALAPHVLRDVRILVVDDEDDALDILDRLLGERGAVVRTARSAREALTLQAEFQARVLISDVGMPEEDGYHLMRKLREREAQGAPPMYAIALTAFAGEEDARRAEAAGFDLHLAKPVEPADLLLRVAVAAGASVRDARTGSGMPR